jgi:peroxiredoxin
MAKLKAGDQAPDMVVQDTTGASLRLSELWHESVLVLTFLRHFG